MYVERYITGQLLANNTRYDPALANQSEGQDAFSRVQHVACLYPWYVRAIRHRYAYLRLRPIPGICLRERAMNRMSEFQANIRARNLYAGPRNQDYW